jgi:ATP-dependent RNA helicase DeaD
MEQFMDLLGTEHPLLVSIKDRGFTVPSEIQEKTIPEILKGKDVIAGASTGSGKTLAFAAGLIKNAKKDHGVQGLVLTPTRELAEQISNEISDFAKDKDLDVIPVYGGVSMINQIKRLEYADIVIGTPGRILDHIQKNSINLSQINTLVLDEADRMLDMGFREDVGKIISHCPDKRQTLLFSATISSDIARLADKYLKDPIEISAKPHVDPTKLTQVYYDADDSIKFSLLKHLLENEESELVLVFCNTRKNVDFVANNLRALNIDALPIHGGFTQDKRNKIMKEFHSSKTHVLVATDVAARGLDIPGISHVYNYDIPPSVDEYTHRIGRTARAGKEGKVINVLSQRSYENFRNLTSRGEFEIKRLETPYVEKVRIKWMPRPRYGSNIRPRYGGNNRSNYRSGNNGSSYRRDSKPSYKSKDNRPRPKYGGNDRPNYNRDSRSNYSRDNTRNDDRPRFGRNNKSSYGKNKDNNNHRSERKRDDRPRFGRRNDRRPNSSQSRRSSYSRR